MKPLVTLENVQQTLGGNEVLKDISFAITPGEHVALLGPSGCGKTTLLHLLAGLATPTSGCISIGDLVVSEPGKILVPPHRRGIGMVFQDLALWPGLRALDNVAAGLPPSGNSRKQRRDAAGRMLELCGLRGLERRRPAELSVGQQQRVALARALVAEPRLLLFDEPFTGLDLTVKEAILHEIAAMAARFASTIILVTHDPWEVSSLCSQAVVLENGTVAEEGELSQLFQAPATETLSAMVRHLGAHGSK